MNFHLARVDWKSSIYTEIIRALILLHGCGVNGNFQQKYPEFPTWP